MPARRGHSAALHAPSGRVVIFGGCGGPRDVSDYLGDTWVLHTQPTYSWEQPETRGAPPVPRRGHRAAMLADSTMLVIGGCE